MKLHLVASPKELAEKADRLIYELAKSLRYDNPDMANRLEKALPRKEAQLKFRALRDIKDITDKGYQTTISNIKRDILKVLNKSKGNGAFLKKSDQKADKGSVLYLLQPGADYKCDECPMFIADANRCTIHGEDDTILEYGSCGYWVHGKPKNSKMKGAKPHGAVTKLESGYTENPDGFSCKRCINFEPSDGAIGACKKVEGQINKDACCNAWEKLFSDYTQPIADKDEENYDRVKGILINMGYKKRDFDLNGVLYGKSVNQLLTMIREKKDNA